MRIRHRVTVSTGGCLYAMAMQCCLECSTIGSISTVDVYEDHPKWPEFWEAMRTRQEMDVVDVVNTEFSKTDIARAPYGCLIPTWHWGYPMPDNDSGYLSETYNTSSYDAKTGTGLRQASPFRIRGEPQWGKRNMLQLNWVFDEFFVHPDLYERVFAGYGVPSMPVIDYVTSTELKTVVQLDLRQYDAPCGLNEQSLHVEAVSGDGTLKYKPHVRGPFPGLACRTADCDICRTREYFGSGANAHRAIVISQAVYRAMVKGGAKGVEYWPMEHEGMDRRQGDRG